MAVTVTAQEVAGNQPMAPTFVDRIRVQGDAAYPQAAGGYDLDLATVLPGKTVIGATMGVTADLVPANIGCVFIPSTGRLKCFVISTGTEVADAGDASALDTTLLVFSK